MSKRLNPGLGGQLAHDRCVYVPVTALPILWYAGRLNKFTSRSFGAQDCCSALAGTGIGRAVHWPCMPDIVVAGEGGDGGWETHYGRDVTPPDHPVSDCDIGNAYGKCHPAGGERITACMDSPFGCAQCPPQHVSADAAALANAHAATDNRDHKPQRITSLVCKAQVRSPQAIFRSNQGSPRGDRRSTAEERRFCDRYTARSILLVEYTSSTAFGLPD